MKIISIGDLHGSNKWEEFEDIKILLNNSNLKPKFDYYVFLGDYVDSFTKTNIEILDNLKRLIQFKSNYPNNVILLFGNHDVQYIETNNKLYLCSGYRPESRWSLFDLFTKNINKFQLAFQLKNYLWTHAGIHTGWYQYEFPYNSVNIVDDLNEAFKQGEKSLFDVGRFRGGIKDVGGPLWCDKRMSSKKPLKNYHQIVGHHPVETIETIRFDINTSITYCDCIEHGDESYYILDTNDLWWPINYDKNRNKLSKTEWKLCQNLETNHIKTILKEVKEKKYKISNLYINIFKEILKNRGES